MIALQLVTEYEAVPILNKSYSECRVAMVKKSSRFGTTRRFEVNEPAQAGTPLRKYRLHPL